MNFSLANPKVRFSAIILLSFVSILLRSYVGTIIPTGWKAASTLLFLLPGIGACAGKALGGFAADRMGAKNVGLFSLALSFFCFAFGEGVIWIIVLGIVLFNTSMSITLCTVASVLPGSPGLAFGLTTLALLYGSVPSFFFSLPAHPLLFAALIAISAICIYFSTTNKEGTTHETSAFFYKQ